MLEHFLAFFKHFPHFNASLEAGLLIFARFMGFVTFAPILSRKDIPMMIKLSLAIILTISFTGILSPEAPPAGSLLLVPIILNFVFGGIVGYTAELIFATISAAGDMVNMQMGLSASTIFNPASKEQTSIIGNLFGYIATVLFMNIGGMYWIFQAFQRSFKIFPLYGTSIPITKVLNMDYLILLTGNILVIGFQIAAPILIATLALDIILGITSKTAPQVNVFQLSFLFKPVIGVIILIILLPLLINIINDYFVSFQRIY